MVYTISSVFSVALIRLSKSGPLGSATLGQDGLVILGRLQSIDEVCTWAIGLREGDRGY